METNKIELALSDTGPNIELNSWAQLDRWIESEQAEWAWLEPHGNGTNVANVGNHVQSNLSSIYGTSKQLQVSAQELSAIAGQMAAMFNGSRGPLLPSGSEVGQAILGVRAIAGDEGAAAAYAFATGLTTIGNLSGRNQLLGVLAVTFPAFEPVSSVADRLSKERANTKAAARAFTDDLRANDQRRDLQWQAMLKRSGNFARKMLKRRRATWRAQQDNLAQQQIQAIADLRGVQHAFEEAMHLQAPVKYWNDKAIKHGKAEWWAIVRLCVYFPAAAVLLGFAFWEAASLLLTGTGPKGPPAGLFIVISGGLAIVSTLALWVGRIFTKLYLSEHHLRNDAEERAVMTTTYLALTRENAASDTDRQVILGALFRNTPDGIVKDEGPGDLNLAAFLSKFGVR